MGEDESATWKPKAIAAYFDGAEQRHTFLRSLDQSGHEAEATTLCLIYIDSFAQWLFWPRRESGRNFVESLSCLGNDPLLAVVHPLQIRRAFSRMKGPWPRLADSIGAVYPGPRYELQGKLDFLAALRPRLLEEEETLVSRELWRGTVAAIAYYRLRNPSVHSFGAGATICFDRSTYQGEPVPDLDFGRLHVAAGRLIAEARRRSEESGQWFGNDAILHEAER